MISRWKSAIKIERRYHHKLGNTLIQRLDQGMLWAEGSAWNGVGRYLLWRDIPNHAQLGYQKRGNMKMSLGVFLILLCLLGLTGCIGVASPVIGLIYTDAKFGDQVTEATDTSRTGEACAQTWFTLVATGDASVEAAKANGGITQVSVVDHSAKNILGIWGKFCTIVKGQ